MADKRKWTEYSDDDKEASLNMLYLAGYPKRKGALSQASKETGVPESTLLSWHKRRVNGSKVRSVKKGSIVAILEDAATKLATRLLEIYDTGDLRETATALGIAVDKLQLLNNEPTENVNNRIVIEYDTADSA